MAELLDRQELLERIKELKNMLDSVKEPWMLVCINCGSSYDSRQPRCVCYCDRDDGDEID